MATTVGTIQTWARFYSNDQTLLLTGATDIEIFNFVYAGMFDPDYELAGVKIGRRWAEGTQEDSSLSTTASTQTVALPSSLVFKEEPVIELQTTVGGTLYERLRPCPDEKTWLRFTNAGEGFPEFYRLMNDSGTVKIFLAPTPNTSSLTIRIRGPIEVTELADATDTTIFLNKNSDRALAKLLASEYKRKRGDSARANELIQEALALLPATEYTPSYSDNRVQAQYL